MLQAVGCCRGGWRVVHLYPSAVPLQALAMGMMTEYYHYLFTTLVSGRQPSAHDRSEPFLVN